MILEAQTEHIIIPIIQLLDELILCEDNDKYRVTFYHHYDINKDKISIFKNFLGYEESMDNPVLHAFHVKIFENIDQWYYVRFMKNDLINYKLIDYKDIKIKIRI